MEPEHSLEIKWSGEGGEETEMGKRIHKQLKNGDETKEGKIDKKIWKRMNSQKNSTE